MMARRSPHAFALGLLLFGIMAAHAMLETARDALFLAHVGPGHLASAYLTIAVTAIFAVSAVRRWGGKRSPRRTLIGFLAIASGGTAGLALTVTQAPGVVFVLYVWTGLVATLAVPALWTLVDRVLKIGDAKRLFGAIGAGGVLGALVGSAAATGLAQLVPAHALISVAAAIFMLTTGAAILAAPDGDVVPRPRPRPTRVIPPDRARRYVRLLLVTAVLSTITLTLGDMMFKRIVAERFSDGSLATAFGAIYTGLNLLGLIVQLLVTPRLLQRLGVGGALTVLPLVIFASVLGFTLTGAAIAIIALKLGDGGLRHSVHRVVTEILFLPLAERVRDAARPMIDVIGQRGGQAAAAVLTFAIASDAGGTRILAVITAAVSAAWIVAIAFMRRGYVQQFRDTLDAGEIQRDVRIPTLDHDSVAMLTGALASPDESEALAALDILARRGDELPALVLYHPSPAVVRRALALLQTVPRRRRTSTTSADVMRVLGHLTAHADPEIRAAALAASSRNGCDVKCLRDGLKDIEPDVRAAAVVGLFDREQTTPVLAAMLDGSTADRIALVRAIARMPHQRYRDPLFALVDRGEPQVTREVLRVWTVAPELADADRLIDLLEDPHVRGDARRVFAVTSYLDRLIEALDDARTPIAVRRHLPRTISRFATPAAAAALVARLMREPDGTTEFKILRALGRMRADNPKLALDDEPVLAYVRRSIDDAARYAALESGLTGVHDGTLDASAILLVELLTEKRRHAIERVFRALGILHARADLRSVHDAITSDDDADEHRASAAREILEDLIPATIRLPLISVLDNAPIKTYGTYEAVIAALLADPSESLRCIAAHHVAERNLVTLRPHLTRMRPIEPLVSQAFDQAIARLADA